MIVPSMKLEEVLAEMMSDFDSVTRKSKTMSNLFQKEMFRKKKSHEIRFITYKSAHYNEWSVVFRIFKGYIHTAYYIETVCNSGKVAYALEFRNNEKEIWLMKYNSHFFKRYRERSQPDITDTAHLIKHFFKYNLDTDLGESQEFDDGTRLVQNVTNEGLCIGWEENAKKVVHFKTFLPHHMLSKQQQSLVEYIRTNNDEDLFATNINPNHFKSKF